LRVGHVDADDSGRYEACQEAVRARAAPEVEHRVVGLQGGQVEEVADASERVDRRRRNSVQIRGGVAEAFGEWPPGLEVELKIGLSATSESMDLARCSRSAVST
jgi:hypothetical protein